MEVHGTRRRKRHAQTLTAEQSIEEEQRRLGYPVAQQAAAAAAAAVRARESAAKAAAKSMNLYAPPAAPPPTAEVLQELLRVVKAVPVADRAAVLLGHSAPTLVGSFALTSVALLRSTEDPSELTLINAGLVAISSDLAKSSLKQYEGAFRRFVQFCEGRPAGPLPALPATGYAVFLYFSHLADRQPPPTYSVIRTASAAIDFFHRIHLIPDCDRPGAHLGVQLLRRGLKRSLAAACADRISRKQPFGVELLVDMATLYASEESNSVSIMVVAWVICSFAGIMRFSDWHKVTAGSLQFNADRSILEFEALARKNDKDSTGHLVVIHAGETLACPIRVLSLYLERLRAEDAVEGRDTDSLPLWRQCSLPAGGLVFSAPFDPAAPASFTGAALSYEQFHPQLLKLLSKLLGQPVEEIRRQFGTHSARRGGATELAAQGASLADIQRQGGWATPDMPYIYIQRSTKQRAGVAALVGL